MRSPSAPPYLLLAALLLAGSLGACGFDRGRVPVQSAEPVTGESGDGPATAPAARPLRTVAGAREMRSEGHRLRLVAPSPGAAGSVMRSEHHTLRLSR